MENENLMNLVAQSIVDHNWVALVVGMLALLVPLVLAMLGKNVPLVKPLLDFAVGVVSKMGKSKVAPKGVAALVPVVEEEVPAQEPMGVVVPLPGQEDKK